MINFTLNITHNDKNVWPVIIFCAYNFWKFENNKKAFFGQQICEVLISVVTWVKQVFTLTTGALISCLVKALKPCSVTLKYVVIEAKQSIKIVKNRLCNVRNCGNVMHTLDNNKKN